MPLFRALSLTAKSAVLILELDMDAQITVQYRWHYKISSLGVGAAENDLIADDRLD